MQKILIIGQAPPAVKQDVPYDTTLLYTMLEWVGISKSAAQDMFEFEAMTDKFPDYGNSGQNTPSLPDMDYHWEFVLRHKIKQAHKIIVLGKFAKQVLNDRFRFTFVNTAAEVLYIVHPSRRNYAFIMNHKQQITSQLNTFINGLHTITSNRIT